MIKSNHIGIDDWQAVAQNLCGMGKVHKKPAASHWDSAADTAANDDDLVVLPPTLPLGYEFVRFKSPITQQKHFLHIAWGHHIQSLRHSAMWTSGHMSYSVAVRFSGGRTLWPRDYEPGRIVVISGGFLSLFFSTWRGDKLLRKC